MSTDPPGSPPPGGPPGPPGPPGLADLPEPHDPSLDGLFRALTADGSAGELAGRPAALAMFRDHRRRPRWRRSAISMSTAAAAIVLAGGIAAAYAAVLPAPVQHIAYRMLGKIGVPDTHSPPPVSGAPRSAPSTPPPAPTPTACGCQPGGPAGDAAGNLVLTVAHAQIPANGDVVFSGLLAPGGRPEPGARVRLLEHVDGRPGWRTAGSAVTDRHGEVSVTVRHLTGNASFRLTAARGASSAPVQITVIPPVDLYLDPGRQPRLATLTARAWFADPGDVVVLEAWSAGAWYRIGEQALDRDHLVSFAVLIPTSGELEYRVVIPATIDHGSSVSNRVRVAAPGARG